MGEPGQSLPPCPHCRAAHPEELLLCPNTNRLLPLEGRVLDSRFRFIKQLGEGGMSTVWMAENFRVRKRVAIKVMHPEFARNPRTLYRFQNEATAAGRIGNPHICDILDLGESPLGPYIVMEMLRGQSFGELLEDQGRIDPPLAVLIICEALQGLIAAHAAGIIHRDLKPENVFLHEPEPGRMLVKLMDFGISKFTEDPGGGRTGANVVMGTPEYMSPEQAAGAANVDARTDIWAMGVMLYRALTGVEPFKGNTMAALLLALSTEDHAPIASYLPQLNPALIAAVERCLAKDPDERYATAEALAAALAPFQQVVAEGERPQAPVRTGKTMAFPHGQLQVPGVTPGTSAGSVSGTAPTGPVATVHPDSAPVSPEARYGVPDNVDDTPTGSDPGTPRRDGTWAPEIGAPPNPGQSWSMGLRTFSDEESRPYRPSRGERGWVGWVVGLGLVGLIGGGVAWAWAAGLFTGAVEAGDEAAETGAVAAVETTGPTPDLPAETGTGTATATATGTETGAETGAETGTETGAEETGTTGGPEPSGDSGGGSGGGSGGSGGGSGGSGGGSGGSGGGSGGSGGGSGGSGGSGGGSKPLDIGSLIRVGSLYTHKSRGPQGSWNTAKSYCRNLRRKRRHGLSKWRMATVNELEKFRSTNVDRLLYWSSESSGGKAKTVTMMSGSASERETSNPTPRAFCVSRR